MARQSAAERIRERHNISDAEAAQVVSMLRATLQVLDPAAGFNLAELSERSGYSRQSLSTWAERIVVIIVWMLRHVPTGRPPRDAAKHPLWEFLRSATIPEEIPPNESHA